MEPKRADRDAPVLPVPMETCPPGKTRVAAYCRVSTLMASQETSLEGQRRYYEDQIAARPDWEPAGIYADAGVSATGKDERPVLHRLLEDCRAGKIDLVLTKSISRFARNTAACLALVRDLTALGVALSFEKERIHTGTMGSEFLLTVLACLAEEESRTLSEDLKWGIRKRFRNGTYRGGAAPYGYRWTEGRLEICPEEAAVVREIFAAALAGKGMGTLAGELNARGVPSRRGTGWTQSVLSRMLRSPVYTGEALWQQTFTDGAFRQRPNRGELDRYRVPAHHPAIVSREVLERAAAAVRRRGPESAPAAEAPALPGVRRTRTVFSGRLFCGRCGGPLYRQRSRTSGYFVYVCETHRRDRSRCPMGPVREEDVKNAFLTVLNKLAFARTLSPGERVTEVYLRELRAAGIRTGTVYAAARRLRDLAAAWRITDRTEAFPEEIFSELVERTVVAAGRGAVFRLTCGLDLGASLTGEGGL